MNIALIDLKKSKLLKKATSKDIFVGNIIYQTDEYNVVYSLKIKEVLNPNDDYKAFMDNNGYRHGLKDAYVFYYQK